MEQTGQRPKTVHDWLDDLFGPMDRPFDELRNKHAGEPALVIGNAPMRSGFPLGLSGWVTIGCNALYREYMPDYLCVFDSEMIGQAVKDGMGRDTNLVLRAGEARARVLNAVDPEKRGSWYVYQDLPLEGLCGHMAIMLAGWLGCSPVQLIGFSCDETNIFADTECYRSTQSVAKESKKQKIDFTVPGSRKQDIGRLRDAFARYGELVPNGRIFWTGDAEWMLEAHAVYGKERAKLERRQLAVQ